MEQLDAVEIILRGPVWLKCPICHGGDYSLQVHDEVLWEACRNCSGCGSVLTATYVEACQMLDLPLPSRVSLEQAVDHAVEAVEYTMKVMRERGVTVDWAAIEAAGKKL